MGKSTFFKNSFIGIFIILSMFVFVNAEDYIIPVHSIEDCFGNLSVKVSNQNDSISGKYDLMNCSNTKDNLWKCSCDLSTIAINTTDIKQEYDVKVQYDINELDDSNNSNITPNNIDIENTIDRRIYDYSNLVFKKEKIKKEQIKLPSLSESRFVIVVLVTVFGLLLFLIVAVFFFIMRAGFKDEERKEIKPKKKEDDEEELDENTKAELEKRFSSH